MLACIVNRQNPVFTFITTNPDLILCITFCFDFFSCMTCQFFSSLLCFEIFHKKVECSGLQIFQNNEFYDMKQPVIKQLTQSNVSAWNFDCILHLLTKKQGNLFFLFCLELISH